MLCNIRTKDLIASTDSQSGNCCINHINNFFREYIYNITCSARGQSPTWSIRKVKYRSQIPFNWQSPCYSRHRSSRPYLYDPIITLTRLCGDGMRTWRKGAAGRTTTNNAYMYIAMPGNINWPTTPFSFIGRGHHWTTGALHHIG